jgi:phosphate-selective porin O and P
MAAGTSITQARLGFFGGYGNWTGRIDVNYTGQRITFCDIYAAYAFSPQTRLVLGHQLEPLSIGMNTSTRHGSVTTPLPLDFLIPYTRHWGLAGTHWGDKYWLGAGLFAGSSERVNARENHMGEGYGVSARAVWRPINTDQKTVHLGFSAVARTPERVTSDDGIVVLGGRSGSVVENRKFIAGGFSGIDHYTICDLEAAYRDDRFFVQGEALCSTFATKESPGVITNGVNTYHIDGSESVSFWGGYLVGSYMLRGKQRSYSNSGAAFSNVNNEVEPGGNVELMIGASAIDTQGYMGKAYEALGAVNWYPNTAMMLGLSYTFTSFSKDATALGRLRSNSDGLSYHTLQLRAQFVF